MKNVIRDSAAYDLGRRFAVLNNSGSCVEYRNDLSTATSSAKKFRGRVVHIVRNSNRFSRLSKRMIKNPIKDFEFPLNYQIPNTTLDRVRESYSPGIRVVGGLRDSPRIEDTTWPIPDVRIPVPQGLNYLPHQVAGIVSMLRKGNALLSDEQGLGKTIEIAGYINATDPDRTLIVCPGTAVPNWIDELKLWICDKKKTIIVLERGLFCQISKKMINATDYVYQYTPLANQRSPEWNICVCKYDEFSLKSLKSEKALFAEENEAAEALAAEDLEAEGRKRAKRGSKPPPRINPRIRELCKVFEKSLDLLVLDECHVVKNVKTQFTMAFFGEAYDPEREEVVPYPGLSHFATKKIFASGTPMVGDKPIELFHILNSLDRKSFSSKEEYSEDFVNKAKRGRKRKEERGMPPPPPVVNADMLAIKLRDTVMLRRMADDVLDLPPMIVDGFPLEETEEIIEARALEQSLRLDDDDIANEASSKSDQAEQELSDSDEDGEESPAEENLEAELAIISELMMSDMPVEEKIMLAKRQAQLFARKEERQEAYENHYKLTEITIARVLMGIAKAKQFPFIYEWVMRNIGRMGGIKNDKLVIFYNYKTTGDIVYKSLLAMKDSHGNRLYKEDQIIRIDSKTKRENGYRGTLVRKFQNDPNVKIFLATISTCSSAITLTSANTTIFMELDWRPGYVDQAMKRTHRYDKTNSGTKAVFEIIPYVEDTIDSNLFRKLRRKRATQRDILDSFPGMVSKMSYDGENTVNEVDSWKQSSSITKYETKFKSVPIPNAKYSLDQRFKIAKAMQQIALNIDKRVKEDRAKGEFLDYEKTFGITYNEAYEIISQAKLIYEESYQFDDVKPAIKSPKFPETKEQARNTYGVISIDEMLPLIWKAKKLVQERSLVMPNNPNGIRFPQEITGLIRGTFKPIVTGQYNVRDDRDHYSPLHAFLYAALRPTRMAIAETPGPKKKSKEEIEELRNLATGLG